MPQTQLNSILKMSQQNSILKSTLETLYHDYTKQFLQCKLSNHIDREVLDDIVEGLFVTSKQSFLTNIIENITAVKKENIYLKDQLAKEQQEYYQKIGMISSRIRKEYEGNILTQKQGLCQIVAIVQELIGQRDIILGVKNLLNQNRMQRQSLLYRQQFIGKLQLQIKQAKNTELKLIRKIEDADKCVSEKQSQIQALQAKFIQKHKQLEKAQLKIAQDVKTQSQLTQKLQKFTKEFQTQNKIIQQNRDQLTLLNQKKSELVENQQFLNKRVQYLKEENQVLRQKIQQIRMKLQNIASGHQISRFEKEQQQTAIKQLQINIHLTKQSSRQEVHKYQIIHQEQTKKFSQQNKQLKQENKMLREKCQALIEKKTQYEKMLIDIRQKYEHDGRQSEKEYQSQISQYKNQLNQVSKVIHELKEDLSTKEQLAIEYQRNLVQTANLKQQIQYLTKPGRIMVGINGKLRVLAQDMQKNIYYHLSLLKEQARQLKKENEFLKTSFNKQIKFLYHSSQKLICQFFVKIVQAKQQCQYCQHYRQLCLNKGILKDCQKNYNPNIVNVTHIGSSKQVNTNTSKKRLLQSVNDLARKYQTIEQQNRYFTNQIQRFCK